jgi:hypothetical protein
MFVLTKMRDMARLGTSWASLLQKMSKTTSAASHALTRDVDATTGLCAGGLVRIGESSGKGLGAFAEHRIAPSEDELVRYSGEVYHGMRQIHLRYGRDGTVPFRVGPNGASEADIEWHNGWKQERGKRGVSATGQYVFSAGVDHSTGFVTMVDAEDHEHPDTSWARYINHSRAAPNLTAKCELVDPVTNERASNDFQSRRTGSDPVPAVRLFVTRTIEPGEELLFSYGGSMGDFVDESDEQ